jgi:hypothetical protein
LKHILAIISTFAAFNIYSQDHDKVNLENDHHEHHKNEIGVANSPVYFIKEKVFAYGLHIHYVRNITKTGFGIGLGYERIFDQHKHNTFGLVGTYRPIEELSFNVSPGLTFEDGNNTARFALHLESSYEFEINDFHIGPAFEIAYDPEDYHVSIGSGQSIRLNE